MITMMYTAGKANIVIKYLSDMMKGNALLLMYTDKHKDIFIPLLKFFVRENDGALIFNDPLTEVKAEVKINDKLVITSDYLKVYRADPRVMIYTHKGKVDIKDAHGFEEAFSIYIARNEPSDQFIVDMLANRITNHILSSVGMSIDEYSNILIDLLSNREGKYTLHELVAVSCYYMNGQIRYIPKQLEYEVRTPDGIYINIDLHTLFNNKRPITDQNFKFKFQKNGCDINSNHPLSFFQEVLVAINK